MSKKRLDAGHEGDKSASEIVAPEICCLCTNRDSQQIDADQVGCPGKEVSVEGGDGNVVVEGATVDVMSHRGAAVDGIADRVAAEDVIGDTEATFDAIPDCEAAGDVNVDSTDVDVMLEEGAAGHVNGSSEAVSHVIQSGEAVGHVIQSGEAVSHVVVGVESVDPVIGVDKTVPGVCNENSDVTENTEAVSAKTVDSAAEKSTENVVVEEEQPALVEELPCCVCGSMENVRCCGRCKATRYCSKGCQESHYKYHEVYCKVIQDLEKLEKDKRYAGGSVREKQLDFWKHAKIVKLVGKKPILRCRLGGIQVDVLWDTGAMISMVSRRWLRRHFPEQAILPVSEFLEGESLTIRAANKTKIPYDGVVVLNFTLDDSDEGFFVPLLVTSQELSEPIIGYNVVEHLVVNGSEEDRCKLQSCLISNKSLESNWDPLISLIEKQAASPDFLGEIKASDSLEVPAGCKVRMRCRVKAQGNDEEQTVYFSPRIQEGDDEVEFNESISRLKRGKTNYVYVDVINS